MNRSQQQTQTTSTGRVPVGSATKSRRGFTLVELLVVIAIIGILIGMLAVSIGPVMTRVYDGAVSTEMKQIELAIENFKNKHGFYPPSFRGITSANDMLPYLNKISANHRETSAVSTAFPARRLDYWWNAIGQHLDDRSSLVFWLSGLSSNKQFPLTGGLGFVGGNLQLPVAFGGSDVIRIDSSSSPQADSDGEFEFRAADGSTGQIDVPRDSYFDFRGGQLTDRVLSLSEPTLGTEVALQPGVRAYNTPYGEESENRGNEYSYRNSAFYDWDGDGIPNGVYHAFNSGDIRYVNPRTFQLFTYGADGRAANVALDDRMQDIDMDGVPDFVLNEDNITNFANGRLEAFDWKANLGL